jgi:Subtilase family
MSSRFLAIGAVGVLTAISAASAVGPGQLIRLHSSAPGISPLHVAGARSPQGATAPSSKFDGALAEISRHVRSEHPGVRDLHVLNPAAKFAQPANSSVPLVSVDAVTRGDPQQLKAALVGLGLQHASSYSNDVGGWLPVDQLDAAAALTEVHAIRAAMMRTKSGAVTSQGDYAQNSDLVRSQNALSGAGITVGIISDSYDCYSVYAANGVPAGGNAGYANNGFTADAATDVSTGDLPSNVTVLAEAQHGNGGCMNYGAPTQLPFGDEGRAMMQIVHDVAPGAALAFYTAENSEADFANGIGALANAGAKVIADDVGYFDEPFFQDGIVAQAIDAVEAQGVAYFSAAGNDGTMAYDNNSPSFATAGSGSNAGEKLLTFGTSGGTAVAYLPVTIPPMVPGEFVAIVLEWDQPYFTGAPNSGGATSQLDLCIENAVGNDIITNYFENPAVCSGPNALGKDPYQVMIVDNPANAAGNSLTETIHIVVGLANGTAPPGRIKVVVEDDGLGSTINQFATHSGTIQGHPNATGALAVGAAFFLQTPGCGSAAAELEYFSSVGGDPILFDVNGNPQTAVYRQKPDLVGPDGGNDTFLGFTLASDNPPIVDDSTIAGCKNNAGFPNFFGTSAATPHVAGIAALLLQADPTLTPAQIYTTFHNSTLPMGTVPNYSSGYGFVQADLAAAATSPMIPAVPALSLGANSITLGNSTTLTWSSANNQGCTAGGSWSGAQPSSGSQTITPTVVGTDTYTLACTNLAGTSPSASVMLTVSPAAVPPAPTLSLASNSITLGNSTMISWSSTNATGCTASGSWSGAIAVSGSQTLTPAATGTDTYMLVCANAIGTSPSASVMLTVNAAASGGGSHGGGALGVYSLLGLMGLWVARVRRALRVARKSQVAIT